MKRNLLFLLIGVVCFLFSSCSNNDNDTSEEDDDLPSIVGTWENGNYFVSFNDNGFYSAYIADGFIDSGDYEQSESVISCENPYFNRKTTYAIKNISEAKVETEISYTDLHGEVKSKTMTFTKTDAPQASKSNTLSGKVMTWRSSVFGNVTMTFNSYNAGIKSASKGNAANYPLSFFYIYIGDKLYFQLLSNNSIQIPSIGGWTTEYNEVTCRKLFFTPNGSIDYFEDVDL